MDCWLNSQGIVMLFWGEPARETDLGESRAGGREDFVLLHGMALMPVHPSPFLTSIRAHRKAGCMHVAQVLFALSHTLRYTHASACLPFCLSCVFYTRASSFDMTMATSQRSAPSKRMLWS